VPGEIHGGDKGAGPYLFFAVDHQGSPFGLHQRS
jgi:hypothetical protein